MRQPPDPSPGKGLMEEIEARLGFADARALPAEDRVPLHDDREARADGFEPCDRCRPLAYQAA